MDENEFDRELSEEDEVELGRLIAEGFKGGILDGEGYRISWSLTIDKFEN